MSAKKKKNKQPKYIYIYISSSLLTGSVYIISSLFCSYIYYNMHKKLHVLTTKCFPALARFMCSCLV